MGSEATNPKERIRTAEAPPIASRILAVTSDRYGGDHLESVSGGHRRGRREEQSKWHRHALWRGRVPCAPGVCDTSAREVEAAGL